MENLTPLTRLEQFLAKIAGDDIELPEVKTRLEYWLKEISENGGGGGGGSSGLVVNVIEVPPVDPEDPEAESTYKLDKTAGEILTAIQNGMPVYLKEDYDVAFRYSAVDCCVCLPEGEDQRYQFIFYSNQTFACDNEDDYPISTIIK